MPVRAVDGQQERFEAWADWALADHADPDAGRAASRRAQRILITSFLSAGVAVTIAIILIMIIAWS